MAAEKAEFQERLLEDHCSARITSGIVVAGGFDGRSAWARSIGLAALPLGRPASWTCEPHQPFRPRASAAQAAGRSEPGEAGVHQLRARRRPARRPGHRRRRIDPGSRSRRPGAGATRGRAVESAPPRRMTVVVAGRRERRRARPRRRAHARRDAPLREPVPANRISRFASRTAYPGRRRSTPRAAQFAPVRRIEEPGGHQLRAPPA